MKLTKSLKNLWMMSGYNQSLSSTYPQVEAYVSEVACKHLPIAGRFPASSVASPSKNYRLRRVIGFISTCSSLLITGLLLLLVSGCNFSTIGSDGTQSLFKLLFSESSEIDKMLVNYARPESGAVMTVSKDNTNHPASALVNGITDSNLWDQGEGWEVEFSGRYSYGQYTGYGERSWMAGQALREQNRRDMLQGRRVDQEDYQVDPKQFEDSDYKTRGLVGIDTYGGDTASAMAWMVFEIPEKRLVNRVILHTINSAKYPAKKYGVSDFIVQYWTLQAKGWQNIDRMGKTVGDQHDSIRNNTKGKVTVRFRPVETTKIRIIIRLTNDSKRRKQGRTRSEYLTGTVRLLEVEIYGLEKKPLS